MKASTVTATYVREERHWRVLIRPLGGPRISRTVPTEEDARQLCFTINRAGLTGEDLTARLTQARATATAPPPPPPSYPPLREALEAFLDDQVVIRNIRQSTASAYKGRLGTWAYPYRPTAHAAPLGDTPWNDVTRDTLGALLLEIRRAGRSGACLEQIRCPLTKFYQWQINVNKYPGPNPAGDLKFYIGKHPSKRQRKRDFQWFPEEEAQRYLAACRALKPRWYAFLLVEFGAGLRWGETTALYRTDIDWTHGRLHVQRTWSEDGGRLEACKDHEDRWVKLQSPAALAALRAHGEAIDLEANVKGWTADQRQLVFPNTVGRITRYGAFWGLVWQPLFVTTGLPYRKPHATRHSYATWMLERGHDLRYVKDQLGHASIEETEGTYGHLVPERHERRGDLDDVLSGVEAR